MPPGDANRKPLFKISNTLFSVAPPGLGLVGKFPVFKYNFGFIFHFRGTQHTGCIGVIRTPVILQLEAPTILGAWKRTYDNYGYAVHGCIPLNLIIALSGSSRWVLFKITNLTALGCTITYFDYVSFSNKVYY